MLDRKLRQSWPARVAAIGFIVLILVGNVWATHLLLGNQIPQWIGYGFAVAIAVSLAGGLGLAALALKRQMSGESARDAAAGDAADELTGNATDHADEEAE